MSLVNCVGLIAQNLDNSSKPVLLIDFDLEAPGLHRYLAPYLNHDSLQSKPGVLEFFQEISELTESACIKKNELVLCSEDVTRLIKDINIKKYTIPALLPSSHQKHPCNVFLMAAGRFDASYDSRLSQFNWQRLHSRAPTLFEALGVRLAQENSYTFIDARTGLSDTSGICTALLPDSLVVVFTPNNQSLTGVEHLVKSACAYRDSSTDHRPLKIYPLPSRIDNQVEHFRRVWRSGHAAHPLFGDVTGYQNIFHKIFTNVSSSYEGNNPSLLNNYFDVVQIPHSADYAFGERLCFGPLSSGDSLSIRSAYEAFLPWLTTKSQPWENPKTKILNFCAEIWLNNIGIINPPIDIKLPSKPNSGELMLEWFEGICRTAEEQSWSITDKEALTPGLRFQVEFVGSLIAAYKGNYETAEYAINISLNLYSEDFDIIISHKAPAYLVEILREKPLDPVTAPIATKWLRSLDKVMRKWQSTKIAKKAWLSALIDISNVWGRSGTYDLAWEGYKDINEPESIGALYALAMSKEIAGNHKAAQEIADRLITVIPEDDNRLLDIRSIKYRNINNKAALRIQKVFISYARADNLGLDDSTPGWVTDFVEKLQRAVKRQVGGGEINFWMDHRLDLQRRVDDELRHHLRESDILLVVMSPRYLESLWCTQEIDTFMQELRGGAGDRVFMVELLPTDRSRWPAQVQNLTAVKFWHAGLTQPEPQTLGWPLPDVRGDRDYWSEVNNLAVRLARGTTYLPQHDPSPLPIVPPPSLSAPSNLPANGPLTILISTEHADEPLATEVQALLADLDADAYIHTPPAPDESLVSYRANFENQLHNSHGVIVIYGQAPRTWVQAKFGEIRKVLALARKGTWAAVLEGPPAPKAAHGLPPRNLMVLDCKKGVTKEQLQPFLDVLRGVASRV